MKRVCTVFSSLIFLFFPACSQNNAQETFQRQALRTPSGIQEMNARGTPAKNGETDADDWRIAPNFSGLIEVTTPAFPNPVAFNTPLQINLFIKGSGILERLQIFVFQQVNNRRLLGVKNNVDIGQVSLNLSLQPTTGTGSLGNIYRIVIRNERNEIITYGDVLVQ